MKNRKTNNFSNIKLLDVTLRDGGYRNNFHFQDGVPERLVKDLTESNIDFIEVGYRNGLSNRSIPVGPTGQSDNDYISNLISHCPNAQISVMLHPMNVTYKDLFDLKSLGVSMIRVCLTAPAMEKNIETINACKALGVTTTANIIKVSSLDVLDIIKKVEALDQSAADVIYIADSFGNLIPSKVADYFQAIRSVTSKKMVSMPTTTFL